MSEQIGKCPYCPVPTVTMVFNPNGDDAFVECSRCKTQGPSGKNEAEAIAKWNAAANALAVKDKTISQLNSALIECEAALADTEEDRHEAVSKLSLALIREVESNKRQDELEAEIARLTEACDDMQGEYLRMKDERDETRRVARVWYNLYNTEYKTVKLINDTFRTAMRDGVVIEAKFGNTGYPYPIPKRMRYYANESGQWLEPVYDACEESDA